MILKLKLPERKPRHHVCADTYGSGFKVSLRSQCWRGRYTRIYRGIDMSDSKHVHAHVITEPIILISLPCYQRQKKYDGQNPHGTPLNCPV